MRRFWKRFRARFCRILLRKVSRYVWWFFRGRFRRRFSGWLFKNIAAKSSTVTVFCGRISQEDLQEALQKFSTEGFFGGAVDFAEGCEKFFAEG